MFTRQLNPINKLERCVKYGDVDEVKKLLHQAQHVPVHLFLFACNNVDMLTTLVQISPESFDLVNVYDRLTVACIRNGSLDCFKFVYERDTSLKRLSDLCLSTAIQRNHLHILGYIFQHILTVEHSTPDSIIIKDKAMIEACQEGCLEALKCMIQCGCQLMVDHVRHAVVFRQWNIIDYVYETYGAQYFLKDNFATSVAVLIASCTVERLKWCVHFGFKLEDHLYDVVFHTVDKFQDEEEDSLDILKYIHETLKLKVIFKPANFHTLNNHVKDNSVVYRCIGQTVRQKCRTDVLEYLITEMKAPVDGDKLLLTVCSSLSSLMMILYDNDQFDVLLKCVKILIKAGAKWGESDMKAIIMGDYVAALKAYVHTVDLQLDFFDRWVKFLTRGFTGERAPVKCALYLLMECSLRMSVQTLVTLLQFVDFWYFKNTDTTDVECERLFEHPNFVQMMYTHVVPFEVNGIEVDNVVANPQDTIPALYTKFIRHVNKVQSFTATIRDVINDYIDIPIDVFDDVISKYVSACNV